MSTIICGMQPRNVVGPRVCQLRGTATPRITQRDLVARLQVLGMMIDQSGLSKIENGQRPVSDIEVLALARALKVSPASLLGEHGDWLRSEPGKSNTA